MQGFLDVYRARIADGKIKMDAAQEQAAQVLGALYDALVTPKKFFAKKITPRGVYIYGGVGRGKSMLMDLFVEALPPKIKKTRLHFHEFMIKTHDWLHANRAKSMDHLIPDYADFVARQASVLCFDEFHVTDVADAMILSRLFSALFERGVVVVSTSNWPPDRLYEGGLQRERFLPFIALLKEKMDIVFLDSPHDYRAAALKDLHTYLFPLTVETKLAADHAFQILSDGRPVESMALHVKGRIIMAHAAGGVARFTFADLCEKPYGAEDYIEIAQMFHTLILENLPKMGYDRRNETKRLMTLVDVMYDRRRRMIITAEAALDKIYYGTDYTFEFARTISRLEEMQSSSYADVAT
jgi:cell division protein ZapE